MEAERPSALVIEAAREAAVGGEIDAFRGQPDALQQAAARKHPRQPQPHADGAGGMGKKGGAERPQPAVEATRQRDLQQGAITAEPRSEEHTSELQSLMRISYAVFCLKTKISYTPLT